MFIGIDVGGTKTSFALADGSGKILAKLQAPSGLYNKTWLQVLIAGVAKIAGDNNTPLNKISRIGVGTPDLATTFEGKKTTLRAPIKAKLEEKYQIPVVIDNDAHVAALGELSRGAGQGYKNFLFVIIGTGVGGAVVINGRLDPQAGEFGHIQVEPNGLQCGCGKKGCLHHYISGHALARRALQAIAAKKDTASKILQLVGKFADPKELAKKVTAEIVLNAARQGDATAQEVIARGLAYLGQVLIDLKQEYKPEVIIMGGGIGQVEDLIITPLNRILAKARDKKVKVIPAALGPGAGLVGAVTLALTG